MHFNEFLLKITDLLRHRRKKLFISEIIQFVHKTATGFK